VFGLGSSLLAFGILSIASVNGNDAGAAAAVLVMGILAVLTIPIARRVSIIGGDRAIFALVMAGFGARMLASLGRYWFAFLATDGVADAGAYDEAGRKLAPAIRALNFGVSTGAPVPGTGFIRLVTATMYAIMGDNPIAAFLVFAWLGFLGLLLFWRAFLIAVPDGDSKRYLKLVLFLPSLLFWPSGISKEAWMVFSLGMCAYGIAGLLTRRRAAFVLIPGIVATTMVRPHVMLLVYCGLIFALMVRRRTRRTAATPAFQMLGLMVLLALGIVIASQTAQFLGVENLTLETVDTELQSTVEHTSSGGSEFNPVAINTPLDIPLATVTVLFRPLPFEAHNLQSLIAAGEGVIFMVLVFGSWSRLRGVRRRIRKQPYIAYSLAFIAVFIFAFSNFSNFGILARERAQMLPLFLVLLALPKVPRRSALRTTSNVT
jgi:hypothetical protein